MLLCLILVLCAIVTQAVTGHYFNSFFITIRYTSCLHARRVKTIHFSVT